MTREAEARTRVSLLRRKGVRFGAKLIFLSVFLLPLAIVFSFKFDSPIPFMFPFIIFLMGLAQVVYTFLFGEHERPEMPEPLHAGFGATERRFNLPAALTTPIPINDSKRINTAEMIRPPSVAEHTTQLLDDDH